MYSEDNDNENENKNKEICVFFCQSHFVNPFVLNEQIKLSRCYRLVPSTVAQKHQLKMKGLTVADTGVISAVNVNEINERHTKDKHPAGYMRDLRYECFLLTFFHYDSQFRIRIPYQ